MADLVIGDAGDLGDAGAIEGTAELGDTGDNAIPFAGSPPHR